MDRKIIVNVAFNIANPLHDQIIAISAEIKEKFDTMWYVDDQRYHLHFPVYLFAAPERNRDKIKGKAGEYARGIEQVVVKTRSLMSTGSGLVMIDFELTPEIYDIHKKAVEMFNPLREGYLRDKYDDPEKIRELAPEDRRHVRDFGDIFVLEKFAPHITIARIKNAEMRQEVVDNYASIFRSRTSNLSRLQVHEAIFGVDDRTELLCDIPL